MLQCTYIYLEQFMLEFSFYVIIEKMQGKDGDFNFLRISQVLGLSWH
jgi:hypothetical protein